MNKIETWKQEKHGLDVWPDLLRYAEQQTPMKKIDNADLERMKWHGAYYRKRDAPESYMLRIRLTGCELTDKQAKEIAYIAYEQGHGIIDITTRANLQVQGLSIGQVPKALTRIQECGLTCKQTGHDNIRNVFGHPLSGIDPDELIDTRDLCREVSELFLDSRDYSDLPRKFNIAISGSPSHGLHYWSQDLSFLAFRSEDDEVLFQVLLGGTQGQNPHLPWFLPALIRPDQVVDVTRALLDLFRAQGSREKRDRARFRFLIEKIGISGVLDWLDDQLEYPLIPSSAEPAPPTGYDESVGWFRQNDPKLWAMGLCVPLGRLTWQQLEGLARLANRWGDGCLRTTPEQDILVTGIQTGFKQAAATEAAGLGLSPHADTLALNTVACTGKQFCNIAVTETKGQMLKLIEKLRQRALTLHGIRIHMSGCPSSCAQHFTADIGLKGVRVRRLLGTREGFDVYLGGGISGQVHLGMPYRLGVDADQLPQLVEEVTREYYLKHRAGQTFSAYWRERLREAEASKVADAEYSPPTWICESCDYQHRGEDPPVYCPSCAALRRHFARIEEGEVPAAAEEEAAPAAPARNDGFAFAAKDSELTEEEGLTVEVAGQEYALFRVDGQAVAIDSACPHEGAPLAQGPLENGVVTCPWHGWTFNACTGCSIDPAGNDVKQYETKIEDGNILLKPSSTVASPSATNVASAGGRRPAKPAKAQLPVSAIIEETPDTKTFRLDNSDGTIPAHLPGQFLKVGMKVAGENASRSFTISSSPTDARQLDLTIKRNPSGVLSNALFDDFSSGEVLSVHGPMGGYFFDQDRHTQPLVLVSAGSGITPMMSILRTLADEKIDLPCTFLHGARTLVDVIFADSCQRLAESMKNLQYHVQLTQPPADWQGRTGRIGGECVAEVVPDLTASRFFLCGPGSFITDVKNFLLSASVPTDQIHTEEFHTAPAALIDA